MKKLISLLLTLILISSIMTISIVSVNGAEKKSGDYYYKVYENKFAQITLFTQVRMQS